ncbi:MAG: ATP-binding cassette domain-containing protein [Myxococcota bacterium]
MTTLGDTLVRARGIRKRFGGHEVLRDVSFSLRIGDVVVLRGENGSGKTTLLNILTGNLEPDEGVLEMSVGRRRERFRWPTHWLQRINPLRHFTPERVCRAGVGRVWQDIRLFGTLPVLDNVAIASPHPSGENPLFVLVKRPAVMRRERQHQARAGSRLATLGMGDKLGASCDKLSLGQMKRVAIARAVQTGARIVMLDEPLAGLDAAGQREVLRYIGDIARTGQHAVVIVEHLFNLPKVLGLATHVWTLRGGSVHIEAPWQVRDEVEREDWGVGAIFRRLRALENRPGGGRLEARGLVVGRGLQRVHDGYDFLPEPGATVPFAHPNGWGKSTLFDAIAGVIPLGAGRVSLDGKDITSQPASGRVRAGLSYLRSVDNVIPGLTVTEHVALVRHLATVGSRFERWRALLPAGGKRAALLSGGERQRLAIAGLPVGSVLLLDEPFLNLDAPSIQLLCSVLDELGGTRVVAFPTPDSEPVEP